MWEPKKNQTPEKKPPRQIDELNRIYNAVCTALGDAEIRKRDLEFQLDSMAAQAFSLKRELMERETLNKENKNEESKG